jgi:hypothetical protein
MPWPLSAQGPTSRKASPNDGESLTNSGDWGFNARLRDELLNVEAFCPLASKMLLRSQRKLHHTFQELVRRQADEVVHDELLGV